MKENKCARLLAYITGLVNLELLLQNEFWRLRIAILRAHLPSRLRLSDPQHFLIPFNERLCSAINPFCCRINELLASA